MGRNKKAVEISAVSLEIQLAVLQEENIKLKKQVVEERKSGARYQALVNVILCFIAAKFGTIKNFQKLGGWKNVWMWAMAIPFLIDVISEIVCIARKDEEHACNDNEKRAERLNSWCKQIGL